VLAARERGEEVLEGSEGREKTPLEERVWDTVIYVIRFFCFDFFLKKTEHAPVEYAFYFVI